MASQSVALRTGVATLRHLPAAVLLAGPTALAFATGGFFDTPRTIAAIVAWGVVLLLVLAASPRLGRPAWLAVAGLGGLAAWAAISMSWAPLLEPARDDVTRLLGYAGALLASALAWRRRRDARLVEPFVAAGALVVVGYGLAGRLLPGVVELDRSLTAAGRLEQPLTYWNAMGALAAIGLTLAIRVAGDATRPARLRTAAAAAAPALGLGLYLTFSRGAIAAFAVGMLVLLALCPEREQLRAVAWGVGTSLVAAAVANALPGVESLSGDARERDGLVELAVLALLAGAAGFAQRRAAQRGPTPGPRPARGGARRRAIVLAVLAVAVAGGPLLAVALDRGSEGQPAASDRGTGRLDEIGSNRYEYWTVALDAFAAEPVRGAGTAAFRVEWLRERDLDETVQDAHSLYLETAAELGLVGLALLAALIAGVAAAARRVLFADRVLGAGVVASLVVFAVHAALDWHWEMPAVAYPALVLAGALLARAGEVRARGGNAS